MRQRAGTDALGFGEEGLEVWCVAREVEVVDYYVGALSDVYFDTLMLLFIPLIFSSTSSNSLDVRAHKMIAATEAWAYCSAMARPIPVVPPVIMAVLPARRFVGGIIVLFLVGRWEAIQ